MMNVHFSGNRLTMKTAVAMYEAVKHQERTRKPELSTRKEGLIRLLVLSDVSVVDSIGRLWSVSLSWLL